MNNNEFQEVVDAVQSNIGSVLGTKGAEYSRGDDRLHNFKRAATVGDTTPAQALLGMKLKHDVSILDMVDDHAVGIPHSKDLLLEKFGDAINYLILLLAIISEAPDNA